MEFYHSMAEYENMRGQIYECVRCRARFNGGEIAVRNDLKCPVCSFKVIQKVKPPIAKRLKAT